MTRLHLVDGTYELFRNHYGAPPATSPRLLDTDGRPLQVGAVRGLIRTLVSMLRHEAVTHIGCAFDTVIESFRNRLFAGYKTGVGLEPALLAQFPLAERASWALGLVTWPMREFEADDALATAAARFAEKVEQVQICTPDKDLAQCVRGERVVLVDRRRRLTLDERAVHDKYGVAPRLIADWLALVGDAADGIPGIAGWGERSAALLLMAHGAIESIPDDAGAFKARVRGAERLARQLAEHRDEALLYRRLTTLRTDVPLPETELEQLAWRGADREALEALCAELGEREVLQRVPRWR